ncbi:hypothetical protein [uncultured Campylobacter sp.]|uniref:hypothetical protein n=1 Tax=uncultured Campylobacter sp. TaxID=218934 RepID=UPI00262455FA|nr:hypothetical protein [uncultured Campylobacter sp.]
MKFYKAAVRQNVRGLNLKFYPTKSRRGLFQPRKFSGKYSASCKFSVGKFTRRAKFNAPKRH